MREQELPRPAATVATIVARDGRFLVVDEQTKGGIRINFVAWTTTVPDAGTRSTG
jgi:hypothetical protein